MRQTAIFIALLVVVAACGDAEINVPVTVTPVVTTPTTVPPTTSSPTSSATAGSTSTTAETTTTVTTTTTIPVGSLDDLVLEFAEVGSGFTQPVVMVSPPGEERRFVGDQDGIVWTVSAGDPEVVFDIRGDVSFQGEQGLLGLAFHPDYVENDHLYVSYIDNGGDSVIESFIVADGGADLDSRREVIRIGQPASNHNGGMIAFGPDGNLWIGLGDGGGANDQFGQGQRVDTLLGSMLRITVGPDIDGYEVPAGNLDGEVWAIGLRNPWRWAFDGDDLWIGDVGQGEIEEVDVVDWTAGNPNFGWSVMEGTSCFRNADCDQTGLTLPIYEYSHAEGCSITGGLVYRGSAIPELAGQFLFADYCTGWLRSVGRDGVMREWLPPGTFSGVTSFGTDSEGEPYVLTAGGSIYQLTKAEPRP